DSARCIVTFWCLMAFIASGYEHSVANMTPLLLALIGNHPETASLGGIAWTLAWVTLGHIAGGAVLAAGAHRAAAPPPRLAPAAVPAAAAEREPGTRPALDASAARP